MANEKQIEILKGSVKEWNEWREENPTVDIDLIGADLSGMDLNSANLENSNLKCVKLNNAVLTYVKLAYSNLECADLTNARFISADLRYSYFGGANLSRANFKNANMSRAILERANLTLTQLYYTNLNEVNLSKSTFNKTFLWGASLCNSDLSNVVGLDNCSHGFMSLVNYQTLEKSWPLPISFLRGIGLPEKFIEQLPSLINRPIEFYSCFISYSHTDKIFARRLHDRLQDHGIRCWLDDHQLKMGDDIYKEIQYGIKMWDKVILCGSEASLTSWWVDNEIDTAFDKERKLMRERDTKILSLIPLNLDGYMFSGEWNSGKAEQVKSRIVGDFTEWEKDSIKFETGFEKLLQALRTEGGREVPPKPQL